MFSDFLMFIYSFIHAWVQLIEALITICSLGTLTPDLTGPFGLFTLNTICRWRGISPSEAEDEEL